MPRVMGPRLRGDDGDFCCNDPVSKHPRNALRHPPHISRRKTMTIKVGDKLPETKFRVMTAEGPQVKTTDDVFKGKKVALFSVPGAYTGTCHKMHLPSIFLTAC